MKSLDCLNVQAWKNYAVHGLIQWRSEFLWQSHYLISCKLLHIHDLSHFKYNSTESCALIEGKKFMNTECHGISCLFCYPRLNGGRGLVMLSKWVYMYVSEQVCQFVFQYIVHLNMLTKWRLEIQNATNQKHIERKKNNVLVYDKKKSTTQPGVLYSYRINKDTFDSRETTTPNVI